MKYYDNPKVHSHIREQSKRDIDAVNSYMDGLQSSVVVVFEYLASGQRYAYSDSFWDIRMFAHQPNSFTTNAPIVRSFTRSEAVALFKAIVGDWVDEPNGYSRYLVSLTMEDNPCGLKEYAGGKSRERSSCWRLQLQAPYSD